MQLSRYGSIVSAITLLALSVPAQAFCGTAEQQKEDATPSTTILTKPTSYEQKATSVPLKDKDHAAHEADELTQKPSSTLYLNNEIQRTKPLPQKDQTYTENIQLL